MLQHLTQQPTHRDCIIARSRSRTDLGPLSIAIHATSFVLLEHPTAGSATIALVGITHNFNGYLVTIEFILTECEDHHCIWLNNCIGKRNYRSFFTFITTCTLLCLYLVGCCIAHVLLSVPSSVQHRSFHDMFIRAPVSFCLAIVCFVLLWMVGSLTLFHCWLIARGVTTHEQVIKTFPECQCLFFSFL